MKRGYAKLLMIAGAVFAISFCLVHLTRDVTKVVNFTGMSDMWSLFIFNDSTGRALFHEVNLDDFAAPPYPERGDSLVSVRGLPATRENYFSLFSTETPQGERFPIEFQRGDSLYTTVIETHRIPVALSTQVWTVTVLRTAMVLGLIFVGLWAYLKRPFSSAVVTLSLFCFTLAIEMCMALATVHDTYAMFDIPRPVLMLGFVFMGLSSPFWLKLQLLFPRRNPYYARHRIAWNLLIFLPAILVSVAMIPMIDRVDGVPYLLILRTVMFLTGYVILLGNYRRTLVRLEKRQIRLVLFGAAPGLLLYVLYFWGIVLFTDSYRALPIVTRLLMNNVLMLLVLCVPVSLGYAIGKYRLLHVEGKLKRGTRFIAAYILLLAVFAGVLWALAEFVLADIGLASQNSVLALGVLITVAFVAVGRKIRRRIEEYFYPERVKLRRLLRDFLASSSVRTEGESFWHELEAKLAEGLSAERIYPVLRMRGNGFFCADLSEPAPFAAGDDFIRTLEAKENPLLFDEVVASGRIILSPDQRDWFIKRKSAILLPLVTKSGLLGFLVISTKTNGEDFTSEELEMLQNLSAQTALVAENLELLGEKLQKEKLEEQLRVARGIQQGLLPRVIPDLPGIEMASCIKFCLDVAGDYYDIIPLEDGRVVLAIGDVSGKGVGAALLMANLQASLRTAQAMGASLSDSARRINRLVYDNTPPEMFITFFMLCIDPAGGTVTYVNAGHNPPLLVKEDASVRTLEKGGLLFGIIEDAVYEEGLEVLEPGDIVLMYTDGVSEAMNSLEEEFGEKRIAREAISAMGRSLNEVLSAISDKARDFHGSEEYEDDFTLLAARLRN
jgi:serine phosphatase RsbU (regulator of sigma subunit)